MDIRSSRQLGPTRGDMREYLHSFWLTPVLLSGSSHLPAHIPKPADLAIVAVGFTSFRLGPIQILKLFAILKKDMRK